MSDDLERQLQAFGRTVEDSAGESMRPDPSALPMTGQRANRRWWSIAGAAACLVAVVVGLVALTGRDAEAPATQPAGPTSTSVSVSLITVDEESLRAAPIAGLVTGCEPPDVVVSVGYEATGGSMEAAFSIALAGIAEHTPPGDELLPVDGWQEVAGDPVTIRYLDRGRGIEALVRIRRDGDEWAVAELAQCVAARGPSVIQTTTVVPTTSLEPSPVPWAVAGPQIGESQVEPSPGQLQLWVSNQSFDDDPVGISIAIDGVTVIDGTFDVGGQHNWIGWVVNGLDPGEHTFVATSGSGARFEGMFTMPPGEPLWAVLDYWYHPDDGEGRRFTFDESAEPIYFA